MSDYIKAWQELMVEPYPWVLFENGTCIILVQPEQDLKTQAVRLLKSLFDGTGEKFGDCGIQMLDRERGWLVSSSHPDIFTLITYDEVPKEYRDDTLSLFSHGRKKRALDVEAGQVIHITSDSI